MLKNILLNSINETYFSKYSHLKIKHFPILEKYTNNKLLKILKLLPESNFSVEFNDYIKSRSNKPQVFESTLALTTLAQLKREYLDNLFIRVSNLKQTYNREDKAVYVASWSGGKDSTFMVDQLLRNGDPLDIIVFSNTGYEFEEMYTYIDKVKEYWEQRYDVKIVLLNKGAAGRKIWSTWAEGKFSRGEYKGIVRGFPFSIGMSWCTRELKIKPYENYIKSILKEDQYVISYIGIAFDEPKRITKEKNVLYPIFDWKIIEKDVEEILIKRGLHNPLYNHFGRTGCYLCPKQNLKSLFKLWKFYPKEWAEMKALSIKYDEMGAKTVKIRGERVEDLESKFKEYVRKNKEPKNNREEDIPIGCFCG